MKTGFPSRKSLSIATAMGLLAGLSPVRGESPVSATISYDAPSASNKIVLTWPTIPGKLYRVRAADSLGSVWQPLNVEPLQAQTNSLSYRDQPTGACCFYKITKLDTEPPILTQTYPRDSAFAVSTQAVVQATLWDETGIDPASLRFAISGQPPIALPDSRLSFSNNALTYTPPPEAGLGAPGTIVTATISVSDTLGNATSNLTWSFQLELPTIVSGSALFLQRSGTKSAKTANPSQLTLLSTSGDIFTYSFTGASSGLANGVQLIDANATGGYTRTVVGFTENPANNTVDVLTRPTKLAELLVSGSLNAANNFIARGSTAKAAGPKALTWEAETGLKFEKSVDLACTVYSSGPFSVTVDQGSQLAFSASLGITANFQNSTLTDFEAAISGNADFNLILAASAAASWQKQLTVPLIAPIHNFYFAFIGPVPIWVETVLEFDLGFSADLAAAAQVITGFNASKSIRLGKRYTPETGWSDIWENPGPSFQWLGPTWQIGGSADLRACVQPKLEVLVYSLAGVEASVEPYLEFSGNWQLNPCHWDAGLYAGIDATIGLDLSVWDNQWGTLPSATFHLLPRTQLWHKDSSSDPPQITSQPVSRTVLAGSTATFAVQAQSVTPLSFQWQRNGTNVADGGRISGAQTASLTTVGVQTADAGNYRVRAGNCEAEAWSQICVLNVTTPPVPQGMVLIPAGSFIMGGLHESERGLVRRTSTAHRLCERVLHG